MAWPPRIPWVAVWVGTTAVALAALVTGLTLTGSAIDSADPGRADRLPPPLRQPLVDGCASGACAVDDMGDSTRAGGTGVRDLQGLRRLRRVGTPPTSHGCSRELKLW